VQRSHRTVVAGVHGLEKVERFRSADLTDDDAFRTHTKAVLDQILHLDFAFAFKVRRAGFKTYDVRLLQLKLSGVFACDDALVHVDRAGQAVEQGRLARTGAARNDGVAANAADDFKDGLGLRRDRAELDELLEFQTVLLELTNGERGAVDGERRGDDVDTRTIGKARVADRARLIDAAADLADNALADVHQLLVVGEANAGLLHLAADFDEGGGGAVDHDVGDIVTGEQRLERTIAQNVVADVFEQFFLLGDRHHDVLDLNDLADDIADFFACRRALELGELRQVDRVDQRVEDGCFDVVVLFRMLTLRLGRGFGPRRRSRLRGRRRFRRCRNLGFGCRGRRDGRLRSDALGGRGIVRTASNFSSRGASPERPAAGFFSTLTSLRWVMVSAISRNRSAAFALPFNSSII